MGMRQSLLLAVLVSLAAVPASAAEVPGTGPLERKGDLAMQMVDGIDRYLMRELEAAPQKRQQLWQLDCSSREAYRQSLVPHRERLERMLGIVDYRVSPVAMELVAATDQPALVARAPRYRVLAVRWPVLAGVEGEGLLLEPEQKVKAQVVAVPDADQTPEMLVGLAPGLPPDKTIRPSAGGERLSRCRAGANRPPGPLVGKRRDGTVDQSAAPGICLSHGLRDGPAHHRLRGAKGAGGRDLAQTGKQARPGRSVWLR
jgi:hypothetical protein